MSLDVKGKNVKLWIQKRPYRDGGTWNDYSIGVSKRNQDGTYTNGYIKVRFGKDLIVPADIPNGTNMDFEGYIALDAYKGKDGNMVKKDMIIITKVAFTDLKNDMTASSDYDDIGDSFSEAEDDIPF